MNIQLSLAYEHLSDPDLRQKYDNPPATPPEVSRPHLPIDTTTITLMRTSKYASEHPFLLEVERHCFKCFKFSE